MAEFHAEQRARIRWKLRTVRGLTAEAAMRRQTAENSRTAKCLLDLQLDVQALSRLTLARGVAASYSALPAIPEKGAP